MKVGVIGAGYVGSAVAYSHQRDVVVIRDPKLSTHSASINDIASCDVIYLCLPSPGLAHGACDTSYLEQGMHDLMAQDSMHNKLIIAKTTAPPDVYRALHQRWPNMVHVPEFLTAANHIQSYQNTRYFVLGGHVDWCHRAQTMLQTKFDLPPDRWMITDIATAALYKYMVNSFLATKVTFLNEFYELSHSLGIDFKSLADLARWEDRMGSSHMQVPGPDGLHGWGGACFPKDVSAIIHLAQAHATAFDLLVTVKQINQRHRHDASRG